MKQKSLLLPFFLCAVIALIPVRATGVEYAGKPFFRNVPALEYKGHNRNFDVVCDSTGRVLVANFEGLMVFDGADWRMIHTPGISRVTCLYRAHDGRIWFGGYNVLGYLASDDKPCYVVNDTTQTMQLGEVAGIGEQGGVICFHTETRQMYEVREGAVTRVEAMESLPERKHVRNGVEVNEEESVPDQYLTALATTSEGVVLVDEKGAVSHTLTMEDGLCSNSVTALAYDGKGSLWGATDNGLFVIRLSPIYTHYAETDGLYGQVTSILKSGNRLFAGTLQGLFLLGADDRFTRVLGTTQACWQLVPASGGGVWAAMAEGLYCYDDRLVQLTSRHTLCVTALDADSYLTGELDGVYYHTSAGVDSLLSPISNVVKFTRDKDNTLWAVTLYRETYRLETVPMRLVQCENQALTLLFEYDDEEGRHWHSGPDNQGLFCDGLSERLAVWGKPLRDYSIQAMEQKEDVAWIGGNFGLIRLDVSRMEGLEAYRPQVFVRTFSMEDSDIRYTVSSDKIDPIGSTLYSYRLKKDGSWSDWTTEQHYFFSHLAPGEYELEVRAMDAHGQTAESERYAFNIPVPLYFRWYALLAYALCLALVLYCWFQWRMHKARMEQLRLECIVEERTRELKDAQKKLIRQEREATVGKLTKGLIDRILNPMNYINNFSHLSRGLAKDLRENMEEDEEKMTENIFEDSMDVIGMLDANLEKIEQHGMATTRILKAMEELLKDHSGKVETINLTNLCQLCIDKCKVYYAKDIEQHHIEVKWEAPDLPIVADVQVENLTHAVMSMCGNSIYALVKKVQKDASACMPVLRLSLVPSTGTEPPCIVVYDNGIGIESTILDKVFDPFFTTKPTAEAPGVGLYLSQQVVQDMGGNIQVKSEKDKFTEFIIRLP